MAMLSNRNCRNISFWSQKNFILNIQETHRSQFLCSFKMQICLTSWVWKIFVTLNNIGLAKNLFGFFRKRLQKNLNELFGQPNNSAPFLLCIQNHFICKVKHHVLKILILIGCVCYYLFQTSIESSWFILMWYF